METDHARLKALTPREIDEVLDHGSHAHLGCHYWRETYVVPLTYVRNEDFIYSHTLAGKKIEMMRANPQVCVQIEEIESLFKWRSVILWGRFEELEGLDAASGMRLLIKKVADLERERGLTPLEVELSAILSKAILFRIRIEKATGRAEGFQ